MILFISNMFRIPWGGSEELWTRTAAVLAKQGVVVEASVCGWPQLDRRICELSQAGVNVRPRPIKPSLITLARRHLLSQKTQIVFDIERSFGRTSPALVAISNAYGDQPIEIGEMCITKGWPFIILTHSSLPDWWPSGETAARGREVLQSARRCFFVSESSRVLTEKQLGHRFENAEVVRNPILIDVDSPIPWPDGADKELRMACVGRLSPEKGQDILLEVLADPRWTKRSWRLTFYGNGTTRDVLERLVGRFGLQDRVAFAGHVPVEEIWRENHLLVMASRCEGGPMATIEAMFCGRPAVVTNVGSNPEVIKDGFTGFLAPAAAVECFSESLERMWEQRDGLEKIGLRAADRIRQIMPSDPVEIFARKLLGLARSRD